MEYSVKETIKNRKSVRTYDGKRVTEEDLNRFGTYLEGLSNPFGVEVEFKILDAKEHDLTSPVIIGTDMYFAAKVKRVDNFEIAFGYEFERACLYAESMGLGTVMLASTLSRDTFEKAMEIGEGEVMPVASPIGYPAKKRSVRETLMRKGIKADERISFNKLFFKGSFEKGINNEDAGRFAEALEMLRWAPSAANKQPWRVVIADDKVHFYECQTIKESPLGDIQKVDIGIGIAHFELTMQEAGKEGAFFFDEPEIATPDNVKYIVSYEENA